MFIFSKIYCGKIHRFNVSLSMHEVRYIQCYHFSRTIYVCLVKALCTKRSHTIHSILIMHVRYIIFFYSSYDRMWKKATHIQLIQYEHTNLFAIRMGRMCV